MTFQTIGIYHSSIAFHFSSQVCFLQNRILDFKGSLATIKRKPKSFEARLQDPSPAPAT